MAEGTQTNQPSRQALTHCEGSWHTSSTRFLVKDGKHGRKKALAERMCEHGKPQGRGACCGQAHDSQLAGSLVQQRTSTKACHGRLVRRVAPAHLALRDGASLPTRAWTAHAAASHEG
jgi:hypothetical protein